MRTPTSSGSVSAKESYADALYDIIQLQLDCWYEVIFTGSSYFLKYFLIKNLIVLKTLLTHKNKNALLILYS